MATEIEGLRPFDALGFKSAGSSGDDHYGTCIFCGKTNKLYVNATTGQFSCKAGLCMRQGNLYDFMRLWYEMWLTDGYESAPWQELSDDRGIPTDTLRENGLAYDALKKRWIMPVRNRKGSIVNFRLYRINNKPMGLPTLGTFIYGFERLTASITTVWLCEGEWDTICLQDILKAEGGMDGVAVIGVPGAGILKDEWLDAFKGLEVIFAYDDDKAGVTGTARGAKKLYDIAESVQFVAWPENSTEGYDIRDFYVAGGTYEELEGLLLPFPFGRSETAQTEAVDAPVERLALPLGEKPSFKELTEAYKRWLYMDENMVIALKLAYAVALSTQLPGDPLWLHIVSPPGGGKTELLGSLDGSEGCHFESTMTAHSLVSGFKMPNGKDPSLIPKLDKKCLICKDFTEVLNLNRQARDEIYATLRGAYDGVVDKSYGNGVHRHYEVQFAMITGVTPAVFAESSANLGERFMLYHLQKGVGYDSTQAVMAALTNAGEESPMRDELKQLARDYLDHPIDLETVPMVGMDYMYQINALAHLVAMLRGSVQRDVREDKLLYRPQHEVPTRIAKQLKRMTECLALLEEPVAITQDVYEIIARLAFDSCIGYNLDILRVVALSENVTVRLLGHATGIPYSTLKGKLDDLVLLGAITEASVPNESGRGAPSYVYNLTDHTRKYWDEANLSTVGFITEGVRLEEGLEEGKRRKR